MMAVAWGLEGGWSQGDPETMPRPHRPSSCSQASWRELLPARCCPTPALIDSFLSRILVNSTSRLLPAPFLKVQFLLWLHVFGLASACFSLLAHGRQQSARVCFWAHMYMCTSLPAQGQGERHGIQVTLHGQREACQRVGSASGEPASLICLTWGWRAPDAGSAP